MNAFIEIMGMVFYYCYGFYSGTGGGGLLDFGLFFSLYSLLKVTLTVLALF
jgi:hypothetical protein